MKGLKVGIQKVIKEFEYQVFHVHRFNEICTCVNYDTKEADPKCKKCLGAGRKIKIKKIKAASQHPLEKGIIRGSNLMTLDRVYYIYGDTNLVIDDLIVDENEVYIVFQKLVQKDFKGEVAFYRCLCSLKKQFQEEFLENFNKIVGDK